MPDRLGAPVGQVGRDVSRAGPHLHHRLPGRVGEHPVQQPGLERKSPQLVDEVVGVGGGDRVVRRQHVRVALVRSVGDHRLPVDSRWDRGRVLLRGRTQEMDPATVLLSRPPFELAHQGLRAARHPAQARLDLAAVGEPEQPLGASAQLAGRLRSPEQQHGEQRPLVGVEPEPLVEDLVVLQRPPPGVRPDDPQQSPLLERPRGLLDGRLVEVDDGVPVARLVAGSSQRVGGEGVRRRHRRLLLQQAAEDALVLGVQDGEIGHPADLRSPAPDGRRAAARPSAC